LSSYEVPVVRRVERTAQESESRRHSVYATDVPPLTSRLISVLPRSR
jgi:hypothetical protein